MISCVSLNPSIDRTVEVDQFVTGGLNRIRTQTDCAAGKGINVALAARVLGQPSECIGFMYENGRALFEKRLRENNVESGFVTMPGDVRVNMKIFDRSSSTITEVNASGTPVNEDQIHQVRELIREHGSKSDFLVLSGSTPPGCPDDLYRILAEDAKNAGCRVILDADGKRMKLGLQARPFLIKPNLFELSTLTGEKIEDAQTALRAAAALTREGIGIVAVSMGGDGAIITDGREAWKAEGMKVDVVSTVAAGDSMIAGMAAALCEERSLEDILRIGCAAATVRCMTPPDQVISARKCMEIAAQVPMSKCAL